jgi:hypothetical protein
MRLRIYDTSAMLKIEHSFTIVNVRYYVQADPMLTENQIGQIQEAKAQSDLTYAHAFNKVLTISYFLKSEEAKKFWIEGVARRMRLIKRAVENIFTLYPPKRKELLTSEERRFL